MTGYAVESREVSFSYDNGGAPSLREVSLAVRPGECVMLCGKSGSGKTTFSRLLNGLCPSFFSGELTGRCTAFGLAAGEAAIEDYVPLAGSVFQNPKTQYFNTDTTAELAFPCENMGLPPEEIRARIADCARQFDLNDLLGRSIFHLSGGEKQRIAFGAACMLHPRLLVLDEPTSNLDDQAICLLHDMMAQMKVQGVTILLAEHRLAWAADLVDRYCYFDEGALAGQWTGAEFRQLSQQRLYQMGLRAMDLAPFQQKAAAKVQPLSAGVEAALSVHGLTVGYKKGLPVCHIASLELAHGEIVGLMGHNGVGKSTLAKTLCGLQKPLEGTILWHGKPAPPRERVSRSFLVMQDVNYQLFADSVREEVLLGAACPEQCGQVLEALGLLHLADRHPMSLSGGQKQRTAIASAMLSGKDLVVLDEPTSGLDYYHMAQVGALLGRLKAQGKCVLVITHDQELAANWCDRVVQLQ